MNNASFSQEKKYKWQFGMQISPPREFTVREVSGFNSIVNPGTNKSHEKDKSLLTYGIVADYFIKEDIAIRMCIGISNRKRIAHREDTIVFYKVEDVTVRQNSYHFSLGLQKNKSFNHIRIYGGSDFLYYAFGRYNAEYTGTAVQFGNSWQSYGTINHPGGYSAGMKEYLGITIFLHKGFSISPEIFSTLLYTKTGGDSKVIYGQIGNGSFNYYYPVSSSITKVEFSNIIGTLNLSCFF